MHYAAARGHLDIVTCLAEHGGDVNAKNDVRDTQAPPALPSHDTGVTHTVTPSRPSNPDTQRPPVMLPPSCHSTCPLFSFVAAVVFRALRRGV